MEQRIAAMVERREALTARSVLRRGGHGADSTARACSGKLAGATPRIADIGADTTAGGAPARESEEERDARILREDAEIVGETVRVEARKSIPAGSAVESAPVAAPQSAAAGFCPEVSVVESSPAAASATSAAAGCPDEAGGDELPLSPPPASPPKGPTVTRAEVARRSAEVQVKLAMMRAESAQRERDRNALRRAGFAPMFLAAARAGPADPFEGFRSTGTT